MIFQKTYQQVLDGTKTQTRRLVKPGDRGVKKYLHSGQFFEQVVMIQENGLRLKWQVGKTYAVQPGRGKKAVGRIRIIKIRRERLQEIYIVDIAAEGCPPEITRAILMKRWFEILWDSLHRKPYRWEDNPEVWVLELEKAEAL